MIKIKVPIKHFIPGNFIRNLICLLFLAVLPVLRVSGQDAAAVGELNTVQSSCIEAGKVPVIKGDGKNITTHNGSFIDRTGRTMFLRGVNLGGSTKVPYSPRMASHISDGFFNGSEVSFTGRPFPLEEADEHFSRLKAWGYHFIRFLVTWEAIEHGGPGVYDMEYLAYLRAVILKAGEYGIDVIIDPHEDVWSRYSGGDGAPLWTFDIIGMDVTKIQESGAALVHNLYGDPFPQMVWYTNNYKLASATLFTLFFGGNDFAPQTLIDGVPVQDFLQEHYIRAMTMVAEQLEGLPNVIGFELMNEPSAGYIGIEDITAPYHTELIGDAPTPWQSILAGEGIPQTVKQYRVGAVGLKETGTRVLNQEGVSVWKDNKPGVWTGNGVVQWLPDGSPVPGNKAYFSEIKGKKVDFNRMYYEPFALKYAEAILQVDPGWIIVVDNALYPYHSKLPDLKDKGGVKWVNGSHWYDDVTLVKKKYIPYIGFYQRDLVFGKRKVFEGYVRTLSDMKEQTMEHFGNVPSLLGEFGIPFDMGKLKAFETGDFSVQAKALDRSFRVAEKNLLNYTLWNYTADNTNERGDQWNGEDLSIFSTSQRSDPEDINSGGRALEAAIRPFPKKINGDLLEYTYDYKKKKLTVRYNVREISPYPTEIFLPGYIYGEVFSVSSDRTRLEFDEKERTLLCYPGSIGEHVVVVEAGK